jgi:hypothetical protein
VFCCADRQLEPALREIGRERARAGESLYVRQQRNGVADPLDAEGLEGPGKHVLWRFS